LSQVQLAFHRKAMKLRDDIRDWIAALIVGGAISVSPQSNDEKPFWKPIDECPKEDGKLYFIMTKSGTLLTGRYDHEINEWAGAAAWYKKNLFAYYAEIPPLGDEDALVIDSSFDDDEVTKMHLTIVF